MVMLNPKRIEPDLSQYWKNYNFRIRVVVLVSLVLIINFLLGIFHTPVINMTLSFRNDANIVKQLYAQEPWVESDIIVIGKPAFTELFRSKTHKALIFPNFNGLEFWELTRSRLLAQLRPNKILIEYSDDLFKKGKKNIYTKEQYLLWTRANKKDEGFFNPNKARNFFEVLGLLQFYDEKVREKSFSDQHLFQIKKELENTSRKINIYWVYDGEKFVNKEKLPGNFITLNKAPSLFPTKSKEN